MNSQKISHCDFHKKACLSHRDSNQQPRPGHGLVNTRLLWVFRTISSPIKFKWCPYMHIFLTSLHIPFTVISRSGVERDFCEQQDHHVCLDNDSIWALYGHSNDLIRAVQTRGRVLSTILLRASFMLNVW